MATPPTVPGRGNLDATMRHVRALKKEIRALRVELFDELLELRRALQQLQDAPDLTPAKADASDPVG